MESVRALGLGIAVLVCLTIACGGDDYDGALDGRQLNRTSFKRWKVKEFPLAGVEAGFQRSLFLPPTKPLSVPTSQCMPRLGPSGAQVTLSHF